MRTRPLERKLLWGVVAIFVIPTALTEGILIVLYRRAVFQDTWGLLLTVLIGLPALMAYLGWVAYAIGRLTGSHREDDARWRRAHVDRES